ncbi:MAG: hypothetical protein IT410_01615 [Candidatus Doudnabacteria bacterium]|nr:hypothetical protein [Candidatus Doudnabacteria bacterium]
MTHKDLLLWVVAGIALILSVIAIVAPKGQESDAAMRTRIQVVEDVSNTSNGSGAGSPGGLCTSNNGYNGTITDMPTAPGNYYCKTPMGDYFEYHIRITPF